jgi:hypothetical protein
MSRISSAAVIAELSKNSLRSGHLLDITFTNSLNVTTVFHLSDLAQDITYNASAYTPSGSLLGLNATKESSDVRVGEMSITLSAVNKQFLTMFLSANQVGQPVSIHRVYLDESGALIGGWQIYSGNLSSFSLSESEEKSMLKVSVSSHWADFDRVSGRRTNHNEQQRYLSSGETDKGFEFASSTVKDIKWGRE